MPSFPRFPKEVAIRRRRPRFFKRDPVSKIPINEQIRYPTMRVVVDEGEALGILTRDAALAAARERGLDLVVVAERADPPVAKIVDHGRYAFQLKKKAQESKKKQKQIHVKEVKFRPRIDQHDYEFKKGHCIRFLEAGDKVKATVQFRGREMTRIELGRKVVNRLQEELAGIGVLESYPSMMGNRMHAIFAPDKKAQARSGKEKKAAGGAEAKDAEELDGFETEELDDLETEELDGDETEEADDLETEEADGDEAEEFEQEETDETEGAEEEEADDAATE